MTSKNNFCSKLIKISLISLTSGKTDKTNSLFLLTLPNQSFFTNIYKLISICSNFYFLSAHTNMWTDWSRQSQWRFWSYIIIKRCSHNCRATSGRYVHAFCKVFSVLIIQLFLLVKPRSMTHFFMMEIFFIMVEVLTKASKDRDTTCCLWFVDRL